MPLILDIFCKLSNFFGWIMQQQQQKKKKKNMNGTEFRNPIFSTTFIFFIFFCSTRCDDWKPFQEKSKDYMFRSKVRGFDGILFIVTIIRIVFLTVEN